MADADAPIGGGGGGGGTPPTRDTPRALATLPASLSSARLLLERDRRVTTICLLS